MANPLYATIADPAIEGGPDRLREDPWGEHPWARKPGPRRIPGGHPGPIRCQSLACQTRGRCEPIGYTNTVPATPIYAPECDGGGSVTEDGGGYQGPPLEATLQPPGGAPTGGLDLSSMLSGTTLGLPTWLVLGVAAYFMFFKKGR